ncbi:MAG: DegT/DnrJ/EryC1/StrS family aminotransferase [Campylobacterota bacterium]
MMEIPFHRPRIGKELEQNINDALSLKGSQALQLEEEFIEFVGTNYAVSTNSGTSALHLSMCALDLKRGDKIICCVNSFVNVPEVVRHFDAEPIFVDVAKNSYLMDLDKLQEVIKQNKSKKLRGIIITHIAGQSVDLDALYAIAKENKLKVIEDASDALGAEFNGKKIGNSGADMVAFSFAPHRQGALANGGMLVTNDEALAQRAQLIKSHGLKSKGWDEFGNLDYVYDIIEPGWGYDISELNAAYARFSVSQITKKLSRLKEIATTYEKELGGLKGVLLPTKEHGQDFLQYIVQINTNRDHFAGELKKRGVNISLQYIPLHMTTYYKAKYELKVYSFPNALENYAKVMSLPFFSSMTNEEINYVCEMIKEVVKLRG